MTTMPGRRITRVARRFVEVEHSGALLLLAATVVTLVWANSPWHGAYESLWTTEVPLPFDVLAGLDLHGFVNELLMTLFFFVVGLEIKRELVSGELSDRRAAALPAMAALGGMVVPAAIFVAFTASSGVSSGWGIPMATDIAFSLGIVAALGRRVPTGAKVFLLTLAVVDDIGAIVVIAVVYTSSVDPTMLVGAFAAFLVIVAMRVSGVRHVAAYVVAGAVMWTLTYRSGVHATTVGVALGLLAPALPAPAPPGPGEDTSVAERLETRLHPWTTMVVVPLFALANAGVRIDMSTISEPVPLAVGAGVVVGLVVGKTLGVSLASWLALRLGIGVLPAGVAMRHVVGLGAVAGIGFTVSLFVSELAYPAQPSLANAARAGVLLASCIAACVGSGLLVRAGRRP